MRHRADTRDAALAAIRAELARLDPAAPDFGDAPPDIRDELARLVTGGHCTARQAAEALARALELTEAERAGEIGEGDGRRLMAQLAERHNGTAAGDN